MQFQFPPSDVEAFVRQWYPPNARLLIEPMTYSVRFPTFGGNAVVTDIIQISAQADFFMFGCDACEYDLEAPNYNKAQGLKIYLTDAGSGRPFMNSEMALSNYTGAIMNAGFSLPYPRYLGGNTAVSVQLRELNGANDNNIIVTLNGAQVRQYN